MGLACIHPVYVIDANPAEAGIYDWQSAMLRMKLEHYRIKSIYIQALMEVGAICNRPVAPAPAQPAPRQAAAVSDGPGDQQQQGADPQGAHDAMPRASGWDPSFHRDRLLQEAYSTIFLKPEVVQ